MDLLFLFFLNDVDDVLYRLQLSQLIIFNADVEFRLQLKRQLYGRKRIDAQVILQVCFRRNRLLVDVQRVNQHFFDLFNHVSCPP